MIAKHVKPLLMGCEPLFPDLAEVVSGYDDNQDTIYSTAYAFAAKLTNGHVVTWGNSHYGGDSSSVQAELTAVDTIYSTFVPSPPS